MEKIKVICPNCGSEVEADKFSVVVFCESCGGKILIKQDKNDDLSAFEKKKLLLKKAFETRDISDIISRAKDVMEDSPNDLFANFLYSYCLLRRGNNNSMLHFFENADIGSATEEEMAIILTEITKSRNYYEKKKAFIEKASASGFDTENYAYYLNSETGSVSETENSELYVSSCKKTNINCAILYSLLVSFVVIVIVGLITGTTDMNSVKIVIAEIIVMAVITVLSNKFGYNWLCLLGTLIISLGTYQVIRLIVAYAVYSSCLRKQGEGISYKSLYLQRKLSTVKEKK